MYNLPSMKSQDPAVGPNPIHSEWRQMLPVYFSQHFFFYFGLIFIAQIFKSTLRCSEITADEVKLKDRIAA